MTDLADHIARSIHARKLFQRGERILVAVSGGLDSMVLLNLLHSLAAKNSWKLTVAHLNHQLRGRGSDADEALVRKTAKLLRLPIVVARANVRDLANRKRLSIEMAARSCRHGFLAKTAARLKIKSIAVAHHADEQLELFFLRLLRGAGSDGLAGMKWRSPSPANPGIKLARPLLDQSKQSLGTYAATSRVPFRDDASNASFDFQRNRIRHELLPLLRKSYQPALDRIILRLMDLVREEAGFLGEAAQSWLTHRKPLALPTNFEKLPVALQRRCVQVQLIQQGIIPDFELIEELRTSSERPIALSVGQNPRAKQLFATRSDSGVIRTEKPSSSVFKRGRAQVSTSKSGKIEFGDVKLAWTISLRRSSGRPKPEEGRESFDADKIGPKITLRHWQPGDRFQPIGMSSAIKLQDFFTNQKIPRKQRHNLILGVTPPGEVFWVEGMRISEKFKLTDQTIRCLQWRWKRL